MRLSHRLRRYHYHMKILTALALARAGSANRTNNLVDELSKSNPANTVLSSYWLPIIRRAAGLDGNPHYPALLTPPICADWRTCV